MKKGDVVKVYQKPYTSEDFEGKAILIRKLDNYSNRTDNDCFEEWEVEFAYCKWEGTFSRIIKVI